MSGTAENPPGGGVPSRAGESLDWDAAGDRMTGALLEVAEIELRGCDSMDPVIVLGLVPDGSAGGRLAAYTHLRPHPGARPGAAFPFDITPAQRAFHRDGVQLFGICHGVWSGPDGALLAVPQGLPGRQAGVVAILGRRGRVWAKFYPILWDEDGGFAGFRAPRRLPAAPVGDLLAAPPDEAVIPLLPRSSGKDTPRR